MAWQYHNSKKKTKLVVECGSVVHFGRVSNENLRTTSNLFKSGLLHNREKERATDKRQDNVIIVHRITGLLSFLNECHCVPIVPL